MIHPVGLSFLRGILYFFFFIALHVWIVKSIAKLQKRLQGLTAVATDPQIRSLRFQLYGLWCVWLLGVLAKLLSLEPLLLVSKAVACFVFCLLLGEFFVLILRIGWKRRFQGEEASMGVFRKWVRLGTGCLGILTAMSNLGYSLNGVFTTLGVGGAAIAFAAQKTLADGWSALSIVLDRPFREGDWIVLPKANIAGQVISIGIRSTRLRTEQNSYLIIPNSVLAAECIENQGRKG